MTAPASLAAFVGPFHGVATDHSEVDRLAAWCAGTRGQTAGAPTPADVDRWQAMLDDYTAWIIGTLQRPPDFTDPDGKTTSGMRLIPQWWTFDAGKAYLPDATDSTGGEVATWAAAWCEANPE